MVPYRPVLEGHSGNLFAKGAGKNPNPSTVVFRVTIAFRAVRGSPIAAALKVIGKLQVVLRNAQHRRSFGRIQDRLSHLQALPCLFSICVSSRHAQIPFPRTMV